MTSAIYRPFLQNSIGDLESFAESNWSAPIPLFTVAIELFHRHTVRAGDLRSKVVAQFVALSTESFAWPSTDVSPTNGDSLVTIESPKKGLLAHLDYRVGANGLGTKERRQLLDNVFSCRLPPVDSPEYMNEWASPGSAGRLKKLADTIAGLVTLNKRKERPSELAIADWEEDLEYLHGKYYVGRYDFRWPKTLV